jgi:phosphoenolpyruvate carboxylase
MEQLITSGLKNRILSNSEVFNKKNRKTIEKLSSISYNSYKDFKSHPSFIPYLEKMSTIKYYSKTNIGSRPSKRGLKGEAFNFDKLRAIPFVGSWNQLKQNVPGFYGLGTSINYFYKNNKIKDVKLLYQEVPFFRALVSNSMMSLTKSFFELTSYMSKDEEFGEFWKIIHDEYILTKKMLLKISNFNELMENEPANKLSIQTRENVVMPLITIQQYALQIVKEIESGDLDDKKISVFEKIITIALANGSVIKGSEEHAESLSNYFESNPNWNLYWALPYVGVNNGEEWIIAGQNVTTTNNDGEESVTQIMIDAQFIDGRLNYIIAYDKELQSQD